MLQALAWIGASNAVFVAVLTIGYSVLAIALPMAILLDIVLGGAAVSFPFILQEERVEDHTIAGYDVFLESVSKPHPRWSTARRGKITILIEGSLLLN